MVPFSFKSELSYLRVMMRQLMVESLELRAEGVARRTRRPVPPRAKSSEARVAPKPRRRGIGEGGLAFPRLGGKKCSTRGRGERQPGRLCSPKRSWGARLARTLAPPGSQLQTLNTQLLQNPNEFAKIQVNPTKSNLFFFNQSC